MSEKNCVKQLAASMRGLAAPLEQRCVDVFIKLKVISVVSG